MDIKAYISSGILEKYVLGLVNESERQEIEQYILQYPEIRMEVNQIEAAVEKYAQSKAVAPPSGLLNTIMVLIRSEDNPPKGSSGQGTSKVWMAAAIGLLLVSLLLGYLLYQSNQSLSGSQQQNGLLQVACDSTESALLNEIAVLRNTGGLIIAMAGTDNAPDAATKVYWNEDNQTTYLDIVNLPAPPADKQYQLWAIVEGTPVDMGVFEIDPTDTLVEAPYVANPAAFAITLEPRGGSAVPTLDEMVVIGQI